METKLSSEQQIDTLKEVQTFLEAVRVTAADKSQIGMFHLLTERERFKRLVVTPLEKISKLRGPNSRVEESLHRIQSMTGASHSRIRKIVSSSQFSQAIGLLEEVTKHHPRREAVNSVILQTHMEVADAKHRSIVSLPTVGAITAIGIAATAYFLLKGKNSNPEKTEEKK